ncbi:MAG: protein kinase [Ardenticatenaceae bacterium]|nr:protein kinase [Ardenticatenaceae bacterium]HBY92574.1 hypothetical protein [Chloroflexota bacterium]
MTAPRIVLDNRYRLIRLLGEGGMAAVWLAHDRRLDRLVAIKRLRPHYARTPGVAARFEYEARAAARLDDARIVQIYDVVVHQQADAYIVMEYVPGEDLKAYLAKTSPLPVGRALRLLREIAQGVAVAHRAGLIHRDLKPANVLLGRAGGVKITDFGLARATTGAGLTEPGTVWGTSHYLAPEQARGEPLTAATDVYALGVVFFEILTGKLPFAGDDPVAVALAHIQQPPPDIRRLAPGVPDSVARLAHYLLAKNPGDRPADAGQLVALLDRYLQVTRGTTAPQPVVPPEPPLPGDSEPPPSPRSKPQRGWAYPLLMAGILLCLAAGLAALATGLALPPGVRPTIPLPGAGVPTTGPEATGRVPPLAEAEPPATIPTPTSTITSRRRVGNGRDFTVPRVPAGIIVLDGRLAEWVGPGVPVTTPTFGVERWNGRRDLSGEAWAAWDEQYLYLAVRVTDDSHVQTQRGWEMYRGDAGEFWLDADLAGDFDEAEGNSDDWEFGFSPGNFNDLRPEAVIYLPIRDESLHAALRIRALPLPDGYTMEARIPWKIMDVDPVPGAVFGYDFDVSDNDLPGTAEEQTHVSTSPGMQWNRPTTFGNLILLP